MESCGQGWPPRKGQGVKGWDRVWGGGDEGREGAWELSSYLYPHGLHRAMLLQACQEEVVVQVLGVLQGQQRGLQWGLHRGPLAHPQVHRLGLRAGRVGEGPGAA